MKIRSNSLSATETFATDFVSKCKLRKEGATVVGLHGDLGSGKTAFSKGVASALGITDTVTSPTFIIMKTYQIAEGKSEFKHLIHIDAYRLESEKEMLELGWSDLIADSKNLILVEWPEKIAGILPNDSLKINFTFIDEQSRDIEVV